MLVKYKLYLIGFGICILTIFGAYVYIQIKNKPEPLNKTEIVKIENEKKEAINKALEYEKRNTEIELKLSETEQKTAMDRAEVARLKDKLKVLVQASSDASSSPSVPSNGLPVQAEEISILKQIVDKQDSQIIGLEKANYLLKEITFNLKLSNDSLKVALDKSDKELVLYKIASDAQIAALKSSRWRGRIEGFATGIVLSSGLQLARR